MTFLEYVFSVAVLAVVCYCLFYFIRVLVRFINSTILTFSKSENQTKVSSDTPAICKELVEATDGKPNFDACEQFEQNCIHSAGFSKPEFFDVLERRGIKYLVHFTRAENLRSIFKHGILPVSIQDDRGITSFRSDDVRLDCHLDGTSFSVMFPNYKMFYSLRANNDFPDYAVLTLDAKILCDYDALFYVSNAAASFGGSAVEDFERMFSDFPGFYERKELAIPDFYTTDPQAEVIVLGEIPVKYINGVYFYNHYRKERYSDIDFKNCYVGVDAGFFKQRLDFEYWRGKRVNSSGWVYDKDLSLEQLLDDVFFTRQNNEKNLAKKLFLVDPPKVEYEEAVVSCRTCFDYVSGACFGASDVCRDYRYTGGKELI